jgi:hypothetical protein
VIVRILVTFLPHLSRSVPLPRPVYTERSTMRSARRFIASVLSGGLLAVSGLACHSSSPATTTTPTTPSSAPTVMLSPAVLTFSNVGTQTVTVTNSGSAALTITSIAASVNFTETDSCVGQSVAVGATCTINVSFVVAAASSGGSSGSLTITDNAADSPESVSLSGPQISQPGAVLSPMSIVFLGGQPIGMSQTVTLTNPPNGNGLVAPLTILRIAINGTNGDDFAIALNTCPSSLAQGMSCTVGVTFAPTGSGMRSGALNFIDNANGVPGNIQIIPVSGTGH